MKITCTLASEMDKEKGLPGFDNPFGGIEEISTADPAPDLPGNKDFDRLLEAIYHPFETTDGGEDFLNYGCANFMSGSGARISCTQDA